MCLNRKLILVIIVFTFTFLMTRVFGQEYIDTIRLQMPNETTIEYLMNYGTKKSFEERVKTKKGKEKVRYVSRKQNLTRSEDLKGKLQDFLSRWKVLGVDLEEKKALRITDEDRRITIEERKELIKVYFPEDKRLALTIVGKHQLSLKSEDCIINIYFDNIKPLEELKAYDFRKIFEKTDQKLKDVFEEGKRKNAPLSAWLSAKEEIEILDSKFYKVKKSSYIVSSPSAGIGNINGQWNTLLNFHVGLVLAKKQRYTDRFGLSYEFIYSFTDEGNDLSEWVDLKYARNISKDNNKVNWLGISFGYCIKRRGDFFNKHKYRFGFFKNIYKNIEVSPQFYFNNLFKGKDEDAYVGVKFLFYM